VYSADLYILISATLRAPYFRESVMGTAKWRPILPWQYMEYKLQRQRRVKYDFSVLGTKVKTNRHDFEKTYLHALKVTQNRQSKNACDVVYENSHEFQGKSNWLTNQPTNQTTNQPTIQPTIQPNNKPINQPTYQLFKQSTSQRTNEQINQTTDLPAKRTNNQSTNQSTK
jgi:hypothetical protein